MLQLQTVVDNPETEGKIGPQEARFAYGRVVKFRDSPASNLHFYNGGYRMSDFRGSLRTGIVL